ncbi:MAG: MBL fold metallo-hydrolase [Acidobacteria bacterium]|nr:MBL fold metallo-hydrolase [Acidobacteriota bacterium]
MRNPKTVLLSLTLFAFVLPGRAADRVPTMQVVLLGTGFPRPDPERAGPAAAVVVGEKVFVVDAGRGVVLRLAAAELPLKSVRAAFLTHLHSDHTAGLPDLFNTSWQFGRYLPFELYGPKGTKKLADAMLKFFEADIHIRRDLMEMHAAEGATINTHVVREGVVYQDAELRVTAFAVDHKPVEPAFGYRFDAGGRSIVISGDTRPSDNLVRYAQGADILVHEAILPEYLDTVDKPDVASRLKSYHTTPDEAGQMAQRAGVKLLVLTHLVPGKVEDEFRERAAKYFKGKIVVGRDLMRF